MNKSFCFLTAVVSTLALSSCSKMGPLSADNFTATPSPLEAVGGKVPVTINGRFPQKYMKKKAQVTVIPVLKYEGGEVAGQSATFQGEKVEGNNQPISYKQGGNYTMKASFDYVPAMVKSELYMTFDATKGKKKVSIPEVKIADGVLSTSALLSRTLSSTSPAMAADAYEHTIQQRQQANIQFLIQQANIRTSELKNSSVESFVQTLKDIRADQERKALGNIEVSAYASPDGGFKLNDKLAAQREQNSTKLVRGILKKTDIDTHVDAKYTAQDWEGFQELVSKSNMQDKDLILRVLSMYKDPEERETQIRNISVAFRELADEILPQLRRARLSINYELIGRSDDEITDQFKTDASQLSVEELIYYASWAETTAEKEAIYKKATELYPNDYRAYNNLAGLAYQTGDLNLAKRYLQQASQINNASAETNLNQGLIALKEGDAESAQNYISKGSGIAASNEILGNLYLAQGNYSQAARSLANVKSNSAALARILNKDYASASQTLSAIPQADATTSYLKAIVASRTNDTASALANLKEAISQDASLKDYASKDLEFSKLFTDSTFKSLVQ